MKVTFNIDCTPEEARQFLGLPNIAPLQEKMMKEIERQMLESMKAMEPETFMKSWMPLTLESWGEIQKLFWAQMGMAPDSPAQDNKKKSSKS